MLPLQFDRFALAHYFLFRFWSCGPARAGRVAQPLSPLLGLLRSLHAVLHDCQRRHRRREVLFGKSLRSPALDLRCGNCLLCDSRRQSPQAFGSFSVHGRSFPVFPRPDTVPSAHRHGGYTLDPAHWSCPAWLRSEEHTSELQSHSDLVCRLLLEKKKHNNTMTSNIAI